MTHRIGIGNTGQAIEAENGQTVLQAALAAGIDFPYGCATGNCGLCVCEAKGGEVDLLPYADGALGPAQQSRGWTLACRAVPRGDLDVRWLANFPAGD
ncbi:MAG: 2Fe-2S iron-sulfur cluster-binding protein [Burkholderiales bacterium]|jgi:ferredoxin